MKPRKPARNPIRTGTEKDRTGSAGILRRAVADIRRRFAGLKRDVLAIFDSIRSLYVTPAGTKAQFGRTLYMLTPDEMAATTAALQSALDRWVVAKREVSHVFWWDAYVAEAAQLGTAQSVANLAHLSPTYAGARSLQQVVYSEPYRTRVALAQIRSYEHWTGLSAGMKSELSQIIGRAVADGKNPRAVRKEIMERLGVSETRAYGYAQTEITNTLRDARMVEFESAKEEFGLKMALLWSSALLPMTRPWHASRNGRTYAPEEVKAFYSVNGNRFRCHCSIVEAMLDEDGSPILSDAAKATFKAEREKWARTRKPR